ncbi:MAG: DUF1611 domain-containing protein [Burkholderiales bacterium]|nr:MAG: DUF1611 domain-containing protein [Burkholderiales bacterium]
MHKPYIDASEATARGEPDVQPISATRVERAKAAYNTRRMDLSAARVLLAGACVPRAGDLLLATVERIGQHSRLELSDGRRATLHVGDEILVCYGERYAPDQFEARLPPDLSPCDLVAAGGIAAKCGARHARMKAPTRIRPVGLVADAEGRVLNLATWALPSTGGTGARPPTIVVAGTMMNAGKTTAASMLVLGLKRRGLRVGAAKVTGTGAGGDRWSLTDAGADHVVDFTDAGVASTFGLQREEVESVFVQLHAHLSACEVDAIVIEVADGLLQRETAMLLASPAFRARCDAMLFAAGDPLGAASGVARLRELGLPLLGVGGLLTASPLGVEEARSLLGVPVLDSAQLGAPDCEPIDALLADRSPDRATRMPAVSAGVLAARDYVKWVQGRPMAMAAS